MVRPLGSHNTKAYPAVVRNKLIKEVDNVIYLIPRRVPYNGGMDKSCRQAIQLLRQIRASLINYEWITRKKLEEIKRGN